MGFAGRLKSALSVLIKGETKLESVVNISVARPTESFSGQIVVVTGGSGAIGSAICRRFAAAGAKVLAAGRSRSSFDAALGGCSGIEFLEIDVANEDSISRAFASLGSGLDVLVNCAGGSARLESTVLRNQCLDVVDRMLALNLRGSLLCSREACRIMKGNGCIINVSSVIGLRGKAGFTEYAAAKAGVSGYTRALALEMGPLGIRVNCVSPGYIPREGLGARQLEYVRRTNCLNTVACADDVAGAVVFLASDEARFITGQDLCVDGGRSLGLMGDC